MTTLIWSDALALELPVMDDTHREFVDLLAQAREAAGPDLPRAWQALVDHTAAHFGQEDQWMQATGFASSNCHTTQHAIVLQIMREALQAGDHTALRILIQELGAWFPHHAQTMDAALALHLRSMGMDPDTGAIPDDASLPTQLLRGCGGASCSGPSGAAASVNAETAALSAQDT